MPDYLPHILALPFVLTIVVVVAATMFSLRHLRPAVAIAFTLALIQGWRAARALVAAVDSTPGDTRTGLAVLPAGFSVLGTFLITFFLAYAIIWAIQTVRTRSATRRGPRTIDPDDRKSHLI